jgi:hypothetical protein
VYVDTTLKRLIRKCASALNVQSAKISVEPLDASIPQPQPQPQPQSEPMSSSPA